MDANKVLTTHNRAIALKRHRGAYDPATLEAVQDRAEAQIERAIQTQLAAAPKLRPEQVAALTALLNGETA